MSVAKAPWNWSGSSSAIAKPGEARKNKENDKVETKQNGTSKARLIKLASGNVKEEKSEISMGLKNHKKKKKKKKIQNFFKSR